MAGMVNFDEVNAVALANLEGLVRDWLPNGRRNGNEWQCGDWSGNPGKSLLINLKTGKGSDFSADEAVGDPIGICAKVFRLDRVEAARKLAGIFGLEGGEASEHTEKYSRPPVKQETQQKEQNDYDQEKQAKLDQILAELVDLRGTPAQAYLKTREMNIAVFDDCKIIGKIGITHRIDGDRLVKIPRTAGFQTDDVVKFKWDPRLYVINREIDFGIKETHPDNSCFEATNDLYGSRQLVDFELKRVGILGVTHEFVNDKEF